MELGFMWSTHYPTGGEEYTWEHCLCHWRLDVTEWDVVGGSFVSGAPGRVHGEGCPPSPPRIDSRERHRCV